MEVRFSKHSPRSPLCKLRVDSPAHPRLPERARVRWVAMKWFLAWQSTVQPSFRCLWWFSAYPSGEQIQREWPTQPRLRLFGAAQLAARCSLSWPWLLPESNPRDERRARDPLEQLLATWRDDLGGSTRPSCRGEAKEQRRGGCSTGWGLYLGEGACIYVRTVADAS